MGGNFGLLRKCQLYCHEGVSHAKTRGKVFQTEDTAHTKALTSEEELGWYEGKEAGRGLHELLGEN